MLENKKKNDTLFDPRKFGIAACPYKKRISNSPKILVKNVRSTGASAPGKSEPLHAALPVTNTPLAFTERRVGAVQT